MAGKVYYLCVLVTCTVELLTVAAGNDIQTCVDQAISEQLDSIT